MQQSVGRCCIGIDDGRLQPGEGRHLRSLVPTLYATETLCRAVNRLAGTERIDKLTGIQTGDMLTAKASNTYEDIVAHEVVDGSERFAAHHARGSVFLFCSQWLMGLNGKTYGAMHSELLEMAEKELADFRYSDFIIGDGAISSLARDSNIPDSADKALGLDDIESEGGENEGSVQGLRPLPKGQAAIFNLTASQAYTAVAGGQSYYANSHFDRGGLGHGLR